VVARKLGVLEPPLTRSELTATLSDFRPELRVIPEARAAIDYVRTDPPLARPARPGYAMLTAAAVGLMPDWTREPLGLPHHGLAERTVVPVAGKVATTGIRWMLRPGQRTARALELQASG
jgi:uncharacterized protein (DUF2236 family)